MDVVVAGLARVGISQLEADVGVDERVAGGGLADVLEGYFLNRRRLGNRAGDLPADRIAR